MIFQSPISSHTFGKIKANPYFSRLSGNLHKNAVSLVISVKKIIFVPESDLPKKCQARTDIYAAKCVDLLMG